MSNDAVAIRDADAGRQQVAADRLTTLDGGAPDVSDVRAQIIKLAFGAAGSARQVDADHPLPVELLDLTDIASEAKLESVRALLASILTELGQKLEAADLASLSTGAKQDAAKAVLDNILTELGQKVEPSDLSGLATATKQDQAKTVLDSIASALAPLATETKLEAVRALLAGTIKVDDAQLGTWGYKAGTSGTPGLPGKRVISISATGGTSGGTIVINGGDAIPLAAGQPFSVPLRGVLTAPTIAFTGTASYFVETLA